ncbi:RNA-directed DNA polymerase, eukaryota, reverse transcriptase zinc-binding domain protein [Tanacetum coccineum]
MRLFSLDSFDGCKVKDRGHMVNGFWVGTWSWRISPQGRALDELNSLTNILNSTILSTNGCDKWLWCYDVSRTFKVKSLTKVIESSLFSKHSLGSHHKWNFGIPRKVNVMVWKASLNRLATCLNLAARGVALALTNCPFCDFDTEDAEHVLIKFIDDGSSFEEEFVGLTVDMDDGRNNFFSEFPDEVGDNRRSPFTHSLVKVDFGPQSKPSFSPATSGLLLPSPLNPHIAQFSQVEDSLRPTLIYDNSRPDHRAKEDYMPNIPLPDLNASSGHEIDKVINQEDKDLEELFYSFQRL